MGGMQIVSAFAGLLMLTGCVQIVEPYPHPYWVQNVSAAEAMGALAGGALGGYLGSQFGSGTGAIAMTGLGVAAGAALGRELGRNLDHPDHPVVASPVVVSQCDAYGRCRPLTSELPHVPGGTGAPPAPDPRT
jgi:hypothetical protein